MSDLRTPLARARGLGSAKHGVSHWWLQRVAAAVLAPLSIWLVASLVTVLSDADRTTIADWFANPFVALAMLAFILTALLHVKLGMQTIIEDYVHKEGAKIAILMINTIGCIALGAVSLLSICKLHFFGI